jgi:hypothetical protein
MKLETPEYGHLEDYENAGRVTGFVKVGYKDEIRVKLIAQ